MSKINTTTWRKVKLVEILDLIIDHRGKTPKKLGGSWSLAGIQAISAKNIKDGKIVNAKDIRYVDKQLYDKWMPEKLKEGDILLTSEAPLGELLYMKKKVDYCLSQRLFTLRANPDKLSSRFLYYYLLSPKGKHELIRRVSGTAAEGIRQAELRRVEINYPEDINEQKRVAVILSAFDDKIELNNKISQNLEQMTQVIFKEWFVKFKFPSYKKAKFVDSELGKIPKGWEVKKLGDVLSLEYGKSLTSINRKNGDVPVYASSGLVGYHNEKLVDGSGIIVGRAGIPGSVYWSQTDFHCVDSTFYVKSDISKYFLYYLLKYQNLESLISGSAVPGINRNLIYLNKIILPDPKIIEKFEQIMIPLFDKIYKNKKENQKLSSLRDLLLRKLMSGEVKVKI